MLVILDLLRCWFEQAAAPVVTFFIVGTFFRPPGNTTKQEESETKALSDHPHVPAEPRCSLLAGTRSEPLLLLSIMWS